MPDGLLRPAHLTPTRLPPPLGHTAEEGRADLPPSQALTSRLTRAAHRAQVAADVEALWFGSQNWGESEAMLLAEALPHFLRLRYLDVSSNPLGENGVRALADSLPQTVEDVHLDDVRNHDGSLVSERTKRACWGQLPQPLDAADAAQAYVGRDTFKMNPASTRGYEELYIGDGCMT